MGGVVEEGSCRRERGGSKETGWKELAMPGNQMNSEPQTTDEQVGILENPHQPAITALQLERRKGKAGYTLSKTLHGLSTLLCCLPSRSVSPAPF